MADEATLEVLIQIRDELAGLNRTKEGIRQTKKEAEGLGTLLRQGLGIGSGMEIARRAVDLLRSSIRATIGDAFRLAGEIKDQSEALGLTAEGYQVLRREMVQAGVEVGRMTMAITSQTQSLAEARQGAGAAREAYKALGLSAADLERMNPEERLAAVARATLDASDRTKAFQAAGQILGMRSLPQLLNALRRVAVEGYDKVAESAKAAGHVMGDDTVARLDAAKKKIEEWKNSLTITTGETLGGFDVVGDLARKDLWGTLRDLAVSGLGPGGGSLLARRAARDAAPLSGAPRPENTPSPAERELQILHYLQGEQDEYNRIVADGTHTELQKRQAIVASLEYQQRLLHELKAAKFGEDNWQEIDRLQRALESGIITEAELVRLREYRDIEAQLAQLAAETQAARGRTPSAFSRMREQVRGINDPTVNPGAMTVGEGFGAGVMGWMLSLGSTGEQVAATVQQSLGGALSAVSAKLSGQDVRSWGDVWRGVLAMILQSVIQLTLQMTVMKAIMGIFGGPTTAPTGGSVQAAGGGTFVTRGPTNFTVGDNPGGVELVSVLPLSGIGRTTVSGGAMAMAGGGMAVVGGGRGGAARPIQVVQNLNISPGVPEAVRAEVVAMMPLLRQQAVDGIGEALARNQFQIGDY